jgi:hypothetical protein
VTAPAAEPVATVPVGSVSAGVFVYSFGFTWNTNKPEGILMFLCKLAQKKGWKEIIEHRMHVEI